MTIPGLPSKVSKVVVNLATASKVAMFQAARIRLY